MGRDNRMPRAGLWGVAWVLLWAGGCASLPTARNVDALRPPRQATLEEVLAAYDAYCDDTITFSASGDLAVRDTSTGRSRQLHARIVAARGGRLYLKASVAIVTGIEVIADGERFWFQVPSKKKVWTGRPDVTSDDGETAEPYYALRPTDITDALVPEPMTPGPGESLSFSGDRDRFLLTLASTDGDYGQVRRLVWINREDLRPYRLQTYDENGDIAADIVWRDWQDDTPREITIVRPLTGYFARFMLDKAQRNIDIPEKAFAPRIPDDYEVVEVEPEN
jgi:outer membrane lipoprotein-sorting protein